MDGWGAFRALSLLGIAFARTVQAQTGRAALEEAVVTARRIKERLADMPHSVAVIDGLRLDEFAATRWEALTLPGIKIGPAEVLDVLSIRGIASDLNFGFEQSARAALGIFENPDVRHRVLRSGLLRRGQAGQFVESALACRLRGLEPPVQPGSAGSLAA